MVGSVNSILSLPNGQSPLAHQSAALFLCCKITRFFLIWNIFFVTFFKGVGMRLIFNMMVFLCFILIESIRGGIRGIYEMNTRRRERRAGLGWRKWAIIFGAAFVYVGDFSLFCIANQNSHSAASGGMTAEWGCTRTARPVQKRRMPEIFTAIGGAEGRCSGGWQGFGQQNNER